MHWTFLLQLRREVNVVNCVLISKLMNNRVFCDCIGRHNMQREALEWNVTSCRMSARPVSLKFPTREFSTWKKLKTSLKTALTAAGLAHSIERLTAEREVAGSILGTGPILRVSKWLRNEGTAFALKMARPSRGSDDHVKWRSRLQ